MIISMKNKLFATALISLTLLLGACSLSGNENSSETGSPKPSSAPEPTCEAVTPTPGSETLIPTPDSADISYSPPDASVKTPIKGDAQISQEQAVKWAKENGASDLFCEIAQYYWKYGTETGIRPEVMYAQAALETNYGNFGGRVTADMNNYAGVKTISATGDNPEDHETFPTKEDGVRGHFNHMCAYTGTNPVGTPHNRYYLALSADWAGTVQYVEDLGGKWCPDPEYGKTILNVFLDKMLDNK